MQNSHLGMSSREPFQYVGKYNTYAITFGFISCKTYIWQCLQGSLYNMLLNTIHLPLYSAVNHAKLTFGHVLRGASLWKLVKTTHMLVIRAPLRISPKCRFRHSGEPLQYASKYNTYAVIFGFIFCKSRIWACPQRSLSNMLVNTTNMLLHSVAYHAKFTFGHVFRGASTICG